MPHNEKIKCNMTTKILQEEEKKKWGVIICTGTNATEEMILKL